jgi:hypothetical protein
MDRFIAPEIGTILDAVSALATYAARDSVMYAADSTDPDAIRARKVGALAHALLAEMEKPESWTEPIVLGG